MVGKPYTRSYVEELIKSRSGFLRLPSVLEAFSSTLDPELEDWSISLICFSLGAVWCRQNVVVYMYLMDVGACLDSGGENLLHGTACH